MAANTPADIGSELNLPHRPLRVVFRRAPRVSASGELAYQLDIVDEHYASQKLPFPVRFLSDLVLASGPAVGRVSGPLVLLPLPASARGKRLRVRAVAFGPAGVPAPRFFEVLSPPIRRPPQPFY